MIDWGLAVSGSLWLAGLALVLAAASQASYKAAQDGVAWRKVLAQPSLAAAAWSGGMLFAAGLALARSSVLWEAVVWSALALAGGMQAAAAWRRRQGDVARPAIRRQWDRVWPVAPGLVALGVIMAALYALVILPWMQPDEARHYGVALHAARLGKPVVTASDYVPAWEQEMIAAMEARSFWWYGFSIVGWDPDNLPASFAEIWGPEYVLAFYQPPLYYALMGQLLSMGGTGWGHDDGILALRLAGLALFGLSLAGIYAGIAGLFPKAPQVAVGVLALAALWPSHLAANAAANPDVLAEVIVVWALFFAVNILRRGPRPGNVLWLVMLAVLGVLTKRTALTAAVILPVTFFIWGIAEARQNRAPGRTARIVLGAVIVGMLGLLFLQTAATRLLPSDFAARLGAGDYWRNMLSYPLADHGAALLRTFTGWFGWMRVALPRALYWLGAGLLVLAALGLIRLLLARRHARLEGWQQRALLVYGIALVVQVALVAGNQVVYADFSGEALPQMRHLYAVAPAIFLFLWLGWRAWTPHHWRRSLLPASIVVLVLFNLYVLGFLLYPFYWL